jgi:fructose-bisphosphate aldolase class I
MDGAHTLERCCEVTEGVLRTVFHQLYTQRVMLEGSESQLEENRIGDY